jgi:hypothetical protein
MADLGGWFAMADIDQRVQAAAKYAVTLNKDVFIYNGEMRFGRDLDCIETINKSKQHDDCLLILTTDGGSPDAAYKISRYLQERYKKFEVLIAGRCKSAGTLLAIGAHELIFTPYGELGPLDIQLSKVDKFDSLQSGLTISDSLNTLEERALDRFYKVVRDYMASNQGLLSFASATKAASDFVTQLYAPVFSRIDPEEIGVRARSMRIATDYGRRLSLKSQNLRTDTLRLLSETYSSHSFVIDRQEAETLFLRVRVPTETELQIVAAMGKFARFDLGQGSNIVFRALSVPPEVTEGVANGQAVERGNSHANGGNSQRADGAAKPPTNGAKRPRRRRAEAEPAKG